MDSLTAEVDSLSAENQSLSDTVDKQLGEKITQVTDDLSDSNVTAWAQASFGDNTICLYDSDHKYFQCISGNTYEISKDGLSKLWHDLSISIDLLGDIGDSMPHEIITISFCDPSGEYILDVVLNTKDHSSLVSNIMCNGKYFSIITPILSEIVKQ